MNFSFKTKLHSLFIIVMLIFIVISTVISYVVSKQLILNNIKMSNESELLLSMQTMQNAMQKSKEQFRLFVEDYKPTIYSWGMDEDEDVTLEVHSNEINSDILAFLYSNKEFSGVYLVQHHQLVGTSLQNQLITYVPDVMKSSYTASTEQKFMDVFIQNGQFTKDNLTEEYVVVTEIGEDDYIVAVLDLHKLVELNNINLLLMNGKNQIVVDSGTHHLNLQSLFKQQEIAGIIHTQRMDQQIITSYVNDKHERYVLIQDIHRLNKQFSQIIWMIGALSLLLAFIFTLVSNKVSTTILTPVYDFINKMREIKGYENKQPMLDYISSYAGRSTVSGNIFKYYFLIFIPVSIVIILSFLSFNRIIESNSKQDLSNIFSKTSDGVENNLRSYTSYIRYLSLDREFQNLLLVADHNPVKPTSAAFSDILVRKGIMNKEIRTISIYNSKNQLLYTNGNQPLDQLASFVTKSDEDDNAPQLEIVRNELDSMQPLVTMKKTVVNLSKFTEDMKKFDTMGYIELGIQNMFMSTSLFKLPESNYDVNVLDDHGQRFLLTTPQEKTAKKTIVGTFPLLDEKWHLEFRASNYWNKQKYVFVLLYSLELGIMLLIIIGASSMLGKRMTAPILRAIRVMEEYPYHTSVRHQGGEREFEFIVLAKSFNQMLNRLEQLTAELREKELENVLLDRRINKLTLQALQAQINPHFLHNIFTSIMMLLKTGKNDKVADMLVDTAHFLKSGLYGIRDSVTLCAELDHVRTYMKLQTIRYDHQLNLEIDVDEQYEQLRMPKFILQPLIENSIHHGMEKDQCLTIRIYSDVLDPDTIAIVVTDDGKGMTMDRYLEMTNQLETRSHSTHYGLSNVHERIALEFGDPYGLTIGQPQLRGTMISITMPIHMEEK